MHYFLPTSKPPCVSMRPERRRPYLFLAHLPRVLELRLEERHRVDLGRAAALAAIISAAAAAAGGARSIPIIVPVVVITVKVERLV